MNYVAAQENIATVFSNSDIIYRRIAFQERGM